MSVAANSVTAAAAMSWKHTKAVTGLATASQGPDSFSFVPSINTTTYGEIYTSVFNLAAAGTSTIDFNSWTDPLGSAVTATKALGLMVKATASVTGGQLKIEPGASNALQWFFGGASESITLDVGTAGAALWLIEGTTQTVSGTAKNIKFSNPGSQTITVSLAVILGT